MAATAADRAAARGRPGQRIALTDSLSVRQAARVGPGLTEPTASLRKGQPLAVFSRDFERLDECSRVSPTLAADRQARL